ncbi:phospholipase A1 VesT1.02-like [Episyrphus balteatus]|uniref:phospholipase A1 VesT1.02-like n=1 Tax=Episyrphus balteatus TaxID=286459 RepID=UPI0024860B95|nr:phospholipase A1 VesT1.02-like [Episyrphus balteatus]
MKSFALALLSLTAVVALPLEKSLKDESSEDGWLVPQLDGSIKWMTREQADMDIRHDERARKAKPVKVEFYLYTRNNPDEPDQLLLDDVDSLKNSNFNKKHPTRFIIHGWQNDYKSDVNTITRDALLTTGDYNVISVNWSNKANKLNYATSAKYVPDVGKIVAQMIDFLVTKGKMSMKTLNVFGHSLGAHAAGYAGKHVTEGEIPIIIAFDPALPLFKYENCDERLCDTDAAYVESIQTNGGLLGFLMPIGKAAFYPNGGKSQPGCGLDLAGTCAHSRSYIYYAEAIKEQYFLSLKCENWETAVKKACPEDNGVALLGNPKNYKYASGSFFTPVNKKAPYGRK